MGTSWEKVEKMIDKRTASSPCSPVTLLPLRGLLGRLKARGRAQVVEHAGADQHRHDQVDGQDDPLQKLDLRVRAHTQLSAGSCTCSSK